MKKKDFIYYIFKRKKQIFSVKKTKKKGENKSHPL